MNIKATLSTLVLAFTLTLSFGQYYTIYNFVSGTGSTPHGSLTLSVTGDTVFGTNYWDSAYGSGNGFCIPKNGPWWDYSVVFGFTPTNGANPAGSLLLSNDSLYGTAEYGGTGYSGPYTGYGVIFGTPTNGFGRKTYKFNGTTGANPYGSLLLSATGDTLYGTAANGGTYGNGVVFAINRNLTGYTVLNNFNGTAGSYPQGSLILSGDTLYGMTEYGGANSDGVIFSMLTNGTGYTDLFDFNGANGKFPYGSLILSGGTLYGMTEAGGTNNTGVVFSVKTNGTNFIDLLNFSGPNSNPLGSLIFSVTQDTLFGMSQRGGAYNDGFIFSLKTNGSGYRDVYDFNGTNGAYPYGSLLLSNNTLYGMTFGGGSHSVGVIFSYSLPTPLSTQNINNVNETLRLYPNPATQNINLVFANRNTTLCSKIDILDISGRVVFTAKGNLCADNSQTLDISGLASGMYMVRIFTNQAEYYTNFLKL